MDTRWIAVLALAAACTVPDPDYVGDSGASSDADTQAEASDGNAEDSGSATSEGSTTSAEGGDGDTSTDTGTATMGTMGTMGGDGDDTADAGDGDGTSGDSGDGDGGTAGDGDGDEFQYTTRECDQADPSVGMAEVQPIFNLHCIECHSGGMAPSSQDLTAGNAHASLVNVTAANCSKMRVIPNEPAASYLLDKLENLDLCGGTQMPKNADPLSLEDRTTIQDWICNGAPE